MACGRHADCTRFHCDENGALESEKHKWRLMAVTSSGNELSIVFTLASRASNSGAVIIM